jgi:FkbM family methyltransferase
MTVKSVSEIALSRIRRSATYQRMSASSIGGLYRRLKGPQWSEDRAKEVEFYRSLLCGFKQGDTIFDVGANTGEKAATFIQLGARVVAVEPDELNLKRLRTRFMRFQRTHVPISIVGVAVSDREGTETMLVDGPGSALNTLSTKWADTLKADKSRIVNDIDALDFKYKKAVTTTTLDKLIEENGAPLFVKIDVEGYELSVLQGLHRAVPYISFEVNLPEFREEGLQCIELLNRLHEGGEFNYSSDCRLGFTGAEWLPARAFSQVLAECDESSIEVFWRSNQ